MKASLDPRALALALLLLPPAGAAAERPSALQEAGALFRLKCAKCHTIGMGDRVGPDLRGVARRRERDWLTGFILRPGAYLDSDPIAKRLLERFHGVRMDETRLSPAQVEGLLAYIEAQGSAPAARAASAPAGEPLERKVRTPDEGLRVFLPGLAASLLLLAVGALLWRLGGLWSAGTLVILAAAAGYGSLGGRRHHRLLGNDQGYEPVQPVAFSHAKHAGELRIACLHCHFGAEKGPVAGVPPLALCMNCHRTIRKASGENIDSNEIAKLIAAWEHREDEPAAALRWIRVHRLPDFARFDHGVHAANNIQCQECHGAVQRMERMRQAASLSMGWCLSCHRLGAGEAPPHWLRSGGPKDCTACHL